MHALGMRIGAHCRAGDLILLNGPLGAGKTVLVQGIGQALGITDVTSPTFVISRIHKAPLSLIHVDAYRLLEGGNAAAYLDDLDLDTPEEELSTEYLRDVMSGLDEADYIDDDDTVHEGVDDDNTDFKDYGSIY